MRNVFHRFAQKTALAVGSPWAFATALFAIVIWAVIGPTVGFSNTWQLVINTATTIVTFLMVFLIQNTQNRETQSVQLKLDALILASSASNEALAVEEISDEQAAAMLKQFHALASRVSAR